MIRGDIVTIAGKGDFAGKPRPALVVQSDLFNLYHPSVVLCPITGHLTGHDLYRVAIGPGEPTGLHKASEIEIDRVQALWMRKIKSKIGTAPEHVMIAVDAALRRWLDL